MKEIGTVSVEVVWEPRWGPQRMTESAKKRLGWTRQMDRRSPNSSTILPAPGRICTSAISLGTRTGDQPGFIERARIRREQKVYCELPPNLYERVPTSTN